MCAFNPHLLRIHCACAPCFLCVKPFARCVATACSPCAYCAFFAHCVCTVHLLCSPRACCAFTARSPRADIQFTLLLLRACCACTMRSLRVYDVFVARSLCAQSSANVCLPRMYCVRATCLLCVDCVHYVPPYFESVAAACLPRADCTPTVRVRRVLCVCCVFTMCLPRLCRVSAFSGCAFVACLL